MREKLIELIQAAVDGCAAYWAGLIADHLIANGVTVRKLKFCEYCEEGIDGYRTMFGAFSIANTCHGNAWTISTGHCKPRQIFFCPMCGRKLPTPPKEVCSDG